MYKKTKTKTKMDAKKIIKQKKYTQKEVDMLIEVAVEKANNEMEDKVEDAIEKAIEVAVEKRNNEIEDMIEEAVETRTEELEEQNLSLCLDNEELYLKRELVMKYESTIEELEATIAELQDKNKKKVRLPKPLEVWKGNLGEFSNLPARTKFTITKKELMLWCKTPNEIKEITAKRDENKNKKDARACDEYEGQCWARKLNKDEGQRCCVAALNGKDYCKTHQTSKLQNGDVRITGKGSIPLNKCLECDAPFNNKKDNSDVKEWFKISTDRLVAFKNKTL